MLAAILDNERLNGPRSAHIVLRPRRHAVSIYNSDMEAALEIISQECQAWGGANSPLVPVDATGSIDLSYARVLAGSQIDGLAGLDFFGLFHLPTVTVEVPATALGYGRLWVAALLKYRSQQDYLPLEIVGLAAEDPWRPIYIACLGDLPQEPDEEFLNKCNLRPDLQLEDFVEVKRPSTSGSLADLLARLSSDDVSTPRRLSMMHLAYGTAGSTSIRDETRPLPEPYYARLDAGPNVIVICRTGSVEDIAMLWNLRAALGDAYVAPLGLPEAEATVEAIDTIVSHPRRSHQGISRRTLYITSASIPLDDLKERLSGVRDHVTFATRDQLLTLGTAAGWPRDEVLVWHDGVSSFVPAGDERHREVLGKFTGGLGCDMAATVSVSTFPFPGGEDVRIDALNWTFAAGAASHGVGSRAREAVMITWPSRLLMAQAVAARRGLLLRESEPGRAAMVVTSNLQDGWELSNLAHAPLLDLLESMAARQGMSWYKQRMRSAGKSIDLSEAVARTADDLPEASMHDFKRALRNNQAAAKYWLYWAERRGLIVKGFPLQCPHCRSKQWTPVAAFAPPIVCRGCARRIETPFGDRPQVDFKYRLSERLRRVYEHDAMGHLLAMRYFQSIFSAAEGSRLVGIHPGMEVCRTDEDSLLGEADNLLLTRQGDFVPIEVKRSFGGVTSVEVEKLDDLAAQLKAPWSAVAVCQYGRVAPDDFSNLENRTEAADPFRLILSYDRLLEEHPVWVLGVDPFAWRPLSDGDIETREKRFVERLARGGEDEDANWVESSMLRRPGDGKG